MPIARRFLPVVMLVAALSTSALGDIYQPGPLPPEFGGGFIPPDRDVFKNIQSLQTGRGIGGTRLGTALFKTFERIEKCYAKGAVNYSKGKASGVAACLHDPTKGVLPRYGRYVNAAQSKGPGLPPCHDFVFDGVIVASLAKGFVGQVYCQSPSGAFLDGVTTY